MAPDEIGQMNVPAMSQETVDRIATEQPITEQFATETVAPETKPTVEEKQLSVIDRGYDMSGDISNRRFTLWKSGLELAMCKPLTGLSFTGVKPYAREHLPDTFIVADQSWSFNTFDNELINIFVSMGIPGLAAVLVWFVLAVKWVLLGIRKTACEELPEVFAMTAVLCILISSALFQGTMFFQTTPNTVMFWLVFGYLAKLLIPDTQRVTDEQCQPK
jgi:O-antigen ligase